MQYKYIEILIFDEMKIYIKIQFYSVNKNFTFYCLNLSIFNSL
jgi:hypothetical protein